jgi:1-deoxy-D-xylulose-5-phosphate reductoisomerase
MRRISVFGATGSIGQNTLDLIARAPGDYDVVALTGGGNIAQLAEDAKRLGADVAVTAYEDRLDDLRARWPDRGRGRGGGGRADRGRGPPRRLDHVRDRRRGGACAGVPGAAARHDAGARQQGKPRDRRAAPPGRGAAHDATILPVDSEHSAIFQGLVGEEIEAVEKIIVTASGGGLRDWPLEALPKATVADAGAHPTGTWASGSPSTARRCSTRPWS